MTVGLQEWIRTRDLLNAKQEGLSLNCSVQWVYICIYVCMYVYIYIYIYIYIYGMG
jgi:hypothetical protein